MAIFEKTIRNQNFDTLLRKLEHAIPDSSWSAELEAGSDFKEGSARCSVRVFERYSIGGRQPPQPDADPVPERGRVYPTVGHCSGRQSGGVL